MINNLVALNWSILKSQRARYMLVVVVAFFVGCMYSPIAVVISCVGFSIVSPTKLFAIEENGGLLNQYLALPVDRKAVVTSRYVLSLIIMGVGIVSGLMLTVLANRVFFSMNLFGTIAWHLTLRQMIFIAALSVLLYSVYNLAMYPLLFKLGYINGRFFGFGVQLLFALVVIGVLQLTIKYDGGSLLFLLLEQARMHVPLVIVAMALTSVAFLLLSYSLSTRAFLHRDM